ncbi:MAG TPA: hypothetical protein ENK91_08050 [Bacteroidetes bacterium]|nr:hypothetical protein [Bacteroidota bacterium]
MKIKLLILLLFSLKIYSQTIEEGKGYGLVLLGSKYNTIIKILGNDYTKHEVKEYDEFYFDYIKKEIIVNFDSDSIVNEITFKTSINKKTKKGLLIKNGITILDVEKVYGDDWWTTKGSGDLGYDCGIRFHAKDSIITKVIIEESDLKDKDYSFYEYIEGVYIPKNLDECLSEIDKKLSEKDKKEICEMNEKEFIGSSHFGLGIGLRNSWGLWKKSRLVIHFNNMGIFHPDDMSGIILASYYRKLKGKKISLKKQVKYYKNYWEKMKIKKENEQK